MICPRKEHRETIKTISSRMEEMGYSTTARLVDGCWYDIDRIIAAFSSEVTPENEDEGMNLLIQAESIASSYPS